MARPTRPLRLTAVPSADPPYDDERGPVTPVSAARPPARSGPPPTYGALALSHAPESYAPGRHAPLPHAAPAVAPPGAPARDARDAPPARAVLGPTGPLPGDNVRPFAAPRVRPRPRPSAAPRPAAGELPDGRWLRGLGQAVAEVLAGRRPPATLADRFTERAHGELVRAGRMLDASRPPFAGRPRVQRPRDDVAEICLLVRCGARRHALALRLERQGVQWLCTDFETA